jgi:restriction endonuclease S subunit
MINFWNAVLPDTYFLQLLFIMYSIFHCTWSKFHFTSPNFSYVCHFICNGRHSYSYYSARNSWIYIYIYIYRYKYTFFSDNYFVLKVLNDKHKGTSFLLAIICGIGNKRPSSVAARSKAWTVFALSNARIVGSNPTQGMDVCAFILCVGSSLASGWLLVQGVLPSV